MECAWRTGIAPPRGWASAGRRAAAAPHPLPMGATPPIALLYASPPPAVDYPADANVTNKLFWHTPRKGGELFRSNLNGFEVELPGPGLGYAAWPR